MGILNPIASKFSLALNVPQEIYVCPADKSHAIVDVGFLKDNFAGTSIISVALTKESNPVNLTSVDYFIDDIELIDEVNSAELNKVVVGKGERIILRVVSGDPVTVRLSGVEEANPKVAAAGKLVGTVIAGTAQTQIYATTLPNVAYVAGSFTVYNSSSTATAEVEMWVTSQATPVDSDKVVKFKVTPQDTTIIENILLLPNEKIFVRSDQANTEYFILGLTVSAV